MKSSPFFNLQQFLSSKIQQSQLPYLQSILKLLHQHMQKCIKNRQYIQAQKIKTKINEINLLLKKKNDQEIDKKMMENINHLQQKHQEQIKLFHHTWQLKQSTIEQRFQQQIDKRIKQKQQQIKKLKEQIDIALPITYTPDDKLKLLKNEQRKYAQQFNFIQAQKIKQQIEYKEKLLQDKYKKIRQNNIKLMIDEINQKYDKQIKQKFKHNKYYLEEIMLEKNRKLKELEDKHYKEIKQAKWIYNQEKKIRNFT